MRYILPAVYLFSVNLNAQPVVGQFSNPGDLESSILTATKRHAGLYRTFEEFKKNAPSIKKGYKVDKVHKTLGSSHNLLWYTKA